MDHLGRRVVKHVRPDQGGSGFIWLSAVWVKQVTSFDGSHGIADRQESLLLTLVEELGGCRDVACVYKKAADIFGRAFAPFEVYGVIASDPEEATWHALGMENPQGPSWGGLGVHQLERESDTDALALKHGANISRDLIDHPSLAEVLKGPQGPVILRKEEDPDLLERLSAAFRLDLQSAIGSSWLRPRGGRGWIFLGSRERRSYDQECMRLFHAAVRVTARMAWYPGLVMNVLRQEKLNQTLRRNIVHDLKTPLTVVEGAARTVRQDWSSLPDDIREEMLDCIIESSERLLLDLHDILQPLEQVWAPHLEQFDLSHLLHRIVQDQHLSGRTAHHTLDLQGASAPLPIRADRRKVRRVVENLLSNAIKYSPPENGEKKTVIVRVLAAEDHVAVSVQDQGLGMTDVELMRVMNRGGRVVDPKWGIEGTGFGLDSCRRILEAHQGRLEGHSVKGQGSTFTLVLPTNGPKADAL